ncbi:hypothetical protein C4K04_2622 [Pseudomonas chlororaphis]|uniref:Uncharacterized protein n=1 Tax=Pseudomonas chlororaphis TaxID=587753 RepID=A0A3G7TMF2_9PSED|nr:hypothetical protein C4K04_2622 [Pseudomonas chlororaphis]
MKQRLFFPGKKRLLLAPKNHTSTPLLHDFPPFWPSFLLRPETPGRLRPGNCLARQRRRALQPAGALPIAITE